MKIAHLILTHKNPAQLFRLISTLNHLNFDFYIHLDKKSDFSHFDIFSEFNNVIFIKKRVDIQWAGYGTIQATLNGFDEILSQKKEYEFINVISGQDFPIKSPDYINNFLISNTTSEFISCESVQNEWKEAIPRIYKYHLINWKIPGKYKIEKIVNSIFPKRKFPLNYEIVGRANWFTITPKAANYVILFLNNHHKIIRYFKYCWGADEFIFSTILYNSEFKQKIRSNLVYVDWTGQNEGHPRILNNADYPNLMNSEKLFARKFDISENIEIIDLLEKEIRNISI